MGRAALAALGFIDVCKSNVPGCLSARNEESAFPLTSQDISFAVINSPALRIQLHS
jgi:hypothetical protein